MFSRWNRAFAWFALATVLVNAQCLSICATASCSSAPKRSSRCHQHDSSRQDESNCSHQHSEFTGPEAGVAKVSVAAAATLYATTVRRVGILSDPEGLSPRET